ncbi:MAG TPA: carbohydrate-binding family 9-like protein [Kofleriaceae bacterium]|jgi:hypothetical protein|nr:carbohydrate-binding family 9-like protein [Kofleriaceae bacterium]
MRLAVFPFACALAACVDESGGSQGKKVDPAYIADNLIAAEKLPPAMARLDVDLGGRAVYLGNTADNETIVPGAVIHVAHYWRVTAPPGPDWRVFAFLKGAPGTADFMSLPATDMEQGHPIASWRAGELIRDPQDFALRADWHSTVATLYVGLIAVGKHGTGDRMAASGPHTLDRAIIAHTFAVDLSHAPAPAGTIHISRAKGPITIDGVANDPGWSSVPISPDFVTAEGGKDPPGKANARMTWDDDNLYLFVSILDSDIFSEYKKHDDKIYLEDCVEIFIDADSNRIGYVELQVNPNNATFDKWYKGTKAQGGDESWDSHMATVVKVKGKPDVAGDADTGWDVEIAIPWADVKGRDDQMKVQLPPRIGDRWRLNVVRVDGKYGANYTATSWNRISIGDFHGPDRMLTAVFADSTGGIVEKAEPIDSAPAPAGGSGSAAQTTGFRVVTPATGSAGLRSQLATGSGSAVTSPASGNGSGSATTPRPAAGSGGAPAAEHAGSNSR